MEAEKLKAEIKEIEDKIYELRDLLKGKNQQLADVLSDFKIGDMVADRDGREFVISAFNLGWGSVRCFGNKIKKDGTPGVVVHEIYRTPLTKL